MKKQLFFLLVFAVCAVAADSLNLGLLHRLETPPLRGVSADETNILAFEKSPTLKLVQYLCGGSAVVLDSLSWTGSTIPSGTNLAGRWISLQNSVAYLADWTRGVHIVDFSSPSDLRDLGAVSLGGQSRAVYPNGERLFVAANSAGIHELDITSPASPSVIENYELGGTAVDVAKRAGSPMFVAEDPVGVSAWDLASPTEPITFLDLPGTVTGIDFAGSDSILLATVFEGSVHLLSYNGVAFTEFRQLIIGDTEIYKSIWTDNVVLVAAGAMGLWVFRLDEDHTVADSGFYIPDGRIFVDVCRHRDLAVVADALGGLWFFDIYSFFYNSIEEQPLPKEITLSAHPNPFNSAVTITIDCNTPLQIEIFDLNGRRVAEMPEYGTVGAGLKPSRSSIVAQKGGSETTSLRNGEFIWSPDNSLPSGVYLVRARFDPSTGSGQRSAQRPAYGRGDLARTGQTAAKRIVYLK